MESKIARAINLEMNPVAIIHSDERAEDAQQFGKGKWGCVMWLFAGAVKGRCAVFDRETYGCWGGGVGLGFGNAYLHFPGEIECFCHFLSSGNEQWARGREVAERMGGRGRGEFIEDFLLGEKYMRSPEDVKRFVDWLPIIDIPEKYVIFKPLKDVEENREEPVVVVFPVNPDQLSALIILANYSRGGTENVTIPFAAGCQAIGILAYKESRSEKQRAVTGLIDVSARKNIRSQLGKNLFTLAIPFKMFQEMEEDAEGSFLYRNIWQSLIKNN